MSIPETVAIRSRDYWFKVVDFLQQNWALVDLSDEGGARAFFIGDTSGVFDSMEFDSQLDAEVELRNNGFQRFSDDDEAAQHLTPPAGPFHLRSHPNGPIYSSGRYWKSSCLVRRQVQDSDKMAADRRRELDIPKSVAKELGRSAVEISHQGSYRTADGVEIDISALMDAAVSQKVSIPPDAPLPKYGTPPQGRTIVEVANETTLQACHRLTSDGEAPLALNFANGVHPGGGFLGGARAQEEVLCRSSGLYRTLQGDPMYDEHRGRTEPDSTDWAIVSPRVPVFRDDAGSLLDGLLPVSFITCAAPYAPALGRRRAANLLRQRIRRILDIASAYEYRTLVLGAWGCGAFRNDPATTATDFRVALETRFCGVFSRVVFAVADWSAERRFLGPFRDVFSAPAEETGTSESGW